MKLSVYKLRCEYLCDPMGIEDSAPRLSWQIEATGKGIEQKVYQIIVADSLENLNKDNGNLWDSGMVDSDQSIQIEYSGKKLLSYQFCFWKVRIWPVMSGAEGENKSNSSDWSKPAKWSMGILNRKEWQGKWISYPVPSVKDSPFFRKDFTVRKKVKRATLYATAKGLYEAYVNGEKVSNDVFTPGWTDYNKRLYYNTYDVTSLLNKGKNSIGSVLGEGWYKGPIGFTGRMNCYGTDLKCLFNMRIEYTDGSIDCVNTDETWKTTLGPILQSTFLWGENYDARQELCSWAETKYNAAKWQSACVSDINEKYRDNASKSHFMLPEVFQAYPCEPVKCTEIIKTIDMWQSVPGSWIFDLGQNFAGVARLRIKAKAGTVIRMRFGEMINPDNTLYVENLRSASSTDTYICKGKGIEEWKPSFTFHGFRYVEVTGLTKKPAKSMITGIVLGSDTTSVGKFSCSDPMVNQLYSNLVWTQRANFLEVPTDCPQRDERLGWTGDAQVYIKTALFNMDVAAFFKKWLVDLEDTQMPDGAVANIAPATIEIGKADAAWGDAITVCPWTIYECYGDTRILKKYFPAMKKWVSYLKSTSDKLIRSKTHCFGDWLSINAETPKEVIQTAFFAHSAKLTAMTARTLKKYSEAKKYENLFLEIKEAFCNEFVSKSARIKGDTQTGYVLALHFDLLPENLKSKAVKHLVKNLHNCNNHLSTGFVGTSYLMHVLTANNQLDMAYKLLLNKTYPSWLYSVANGATTIWERWNGWKKGEGCGNANMNSFSHYAYGAVGEWMFCTLAGIDLKTTAFKKIIIHPQPAKGITNAQAEYVSIYGKICSSWSVSKGIFKLDVSIPPNTTAEIVLPQGKTMHTSESGVAIEKIPEIKVIEETQSQMIVEIASGNYSFAVT